MFKDEYKKAYESLDSFFEDLYAKGKIDSLDGVTLCYREGQNSYALNIMEAIKNKSILFTQAGVGIGKSLGYLIPIFETINNVESFNQVIISTSSIALQQQLLIDIDKVSKLLGINIKVTIAKGIKNYACIGKINSLLTQKDLDEKTKEILLNILKEIESKTSADRSDLTKINDKLWKEIMVKNRGACSNCIYANNCYYNRKTSEVNSNNIIITNHAYLANLMRNRYKQKEGIVKYDSLIDNVDTIIIDEAHNLEDNIRIQHTINSQDIFNLIRELRNNLDYKNRISTGRGLINKIKKFYEDIENNANELLNKNRLVRRINYEVLEFKITKELTQELNELINELVNFYNAVKEKIKYKENIEINKNIDKLREIIILLKDMSNKEKSKNIYYCYYDKKLKTPYMQIGYKSKNIEGELSTIYNRNIPIVFTSATLTDKNGNYSYIKNGLGIDDIKSKSTVEDTYVIASPYDFANNTLVYYNPNMPNPKNRYNSVIEHTKYINALVTEIDKLIRITNGKALILFTSKEDLEDIYSYMKNINYPFELLLATETNTEQIKETFANDTDSCLFATGAFWEGIDIKGSSLSNLIVCHLPYPVVDPVVDYKASKYSKDNKIEVYLNEMVQKLSQGTGRLIRSENDKGIVCILDPRIKKEQTMISVKNVLPFKRYTTSLEEVIDFVDEKEIHKRSL